MFKNPPDRGPATSADSDIELSDQLPEDYLNLMERSMQDCDGQTTGVDPAACHSVGEFLSIVRDNHEEAAKQYRRNCDTSGYAPESLLLLLLLQLLRPRAAAAAVTTSTSTTATPAPLLH